MAKSINFTDATIRKLPTPENDRDEYKDSGGDKSILGLRLRVSNSGLKTFCVLRRISGSDLVRATIGKFGSPWNVESARKEALRIIAEYAASRDPTEAKRRARDELTVKELFDLYLADRIKAGRRSIVGMREQYERYIGELPDVPIKKHGRKRQKPEGGVDWSKRKLSQISPEAIETLHSRIVGLGKLTTANRVVEILSAMFGFAVRKRLINENPASFITPAPENERTRHLDDAEIAAFLEALNQEAQPWKDYLTMLLFVGYRREAIAAMQWSDLSGLDDDSDCAVWNVRGEVAKNGLPITLPVNGRAFEILKSRFSEQENGKPWVFPGKGREGHITSPEKVWERVMKRAEINDFRRHDLRHTLGSVMGNNGVDMHTIGRTLGHKDPKSTMRYVHQVVGTAARAVSVAHDVFELAANKPKVKADTK